jgi:ribosomal protein S27E
MPYSVRVQKHNMNVECGICGEALKKSRESDFMRYLCAHCQIFYYVYAPTKSSHLIGTSQKSERLSIFALLFPILVVVILELLHRHVM